MKPPNFFLQFFQNVPVFGSMANAHFFATVIATHVEPLAVLNPSFDSVGSVSKAMFSSSSSWSVHTIGD